MHFPAKQLRQALVSGSKNYPLKQLRQLKELGPLHETQLEWQAKHFPLSLSGYQPVPQLLASTHSFSFFLNKFYLHVRQFLSVSPSQVEHD